MTSASIAVIIVNYRSPDFTIGAVEAVAAQRRDHPGLRCVVVDGGSGDGSADRLAEGLGDPRFAGWASLLPLPINGGFGWANNQAILRLMQGDDPPDYLHILNPDTIVERGAIAALADELDRHPECGAAGSLLINPDGTRSGSAFRFPTYGSEFGRSTQFATLERMLGIAPRLIQIDHAGTVDWVTGASVMLRAEALKQSGLFDDGFFLYFEEVELMWRMRRHGWSVRHVPESRVAHIGGVTTGVNLSGGGATLPRLPRYWFESRRRLWTRMHGPRGPVLASSLWLTGNCISMLRRLLPRRRAGWISHAGRDMLGYGITATPLDRRSAAAGWMDPPGQPPAWMQR